MLHNICILHEDFIIDDIIIAEIDNIATIQHDVDEINPQDKEESIQKRNALTYMLNERL